MFVEIYIILKYVGTNKTGYAGLEPGGSGFFLNFIKTFIHIDFLYISLIILLIISLILNFLKSRFFSGSLLIPSIFFGLVFIPNLILYAKSGMWERYLIPSTLGIAFLTLYVLDSIKAEYKKIQKYILVFLMGIFVIPTIIAFNKAQDFSKEGREIKALVKTLVEKSKPNSTVMVAIDPVEFYEQSYSFKMYLQHEYNIQLYGYALNRNPDDSFSKELVSGWYSYFEGRKLSDLKSLPDWIIFPDKKILNDFFQESNTKPTDYTDNLLPNLSIALIEKKN
jgi:hypothetical protein